MAAIARAVRRPRWHDVAIAAAIAALLGLGVWALWWDEVRGALGIPADTGEDPDQRPPIAAPVAGGRT